MQDMQRIIDKLERIRREFGVHISVTKTKLMVIRREQRRLENLTVDGKAVEIGKSFKYLG